MRISDWSSDMCSSDLDQEERDERRDDAERHHGRRPAQMHQAIDAANAGNAHEEGDMGLLIRPAIGVEAQRPARKADRSEERRVGKECVSTCRSRWSP